MSNFESIINGGAAQNFPISTKTFIVSDDVQMGLRANIKPDGSVILLFSNQKHGYKIDLGVYPELNVEKARHMAALLVDMDELKARALVAAAS